MSRKLSLAGRELSVPAYYEGQNAAGSPDHYESVEDAGRLKASGRARSINHGKALLIRGPRRLSDSSRSSVKGAWKVVGQTGKRKPDGPGFPHYSSV